MEATIEKAQHRPVAQPFIEGTSTPGSYTAISKADALHVQPEAEATQRPLKAAAAGSGVGAFISSQPYSCYGGGIFQRRGGEVLAQSNAQHQRWYSHLSVSMAEQLLAWAAPLRSHQVQVQLQGMLTGLSSEACASKAQGRKCREERQRILMMWLPH
jgi:hypothetical protein